jgi:5'-nucleotidase
MKFPLRGVLALSLLAVACASPVLAGDDRIHVVLLHTNDLHGQVLPRKATWLKQDPAPLAGGLTRVAAYIDRVKGDARKNNEIVFVVDAGDWYQGTPEGLLDDGAGYVRALGFTGYDALCIGNHEFDHGIPNLKSILAETRVPAVAANLNVKGQDERVDWVAPWRVVERGGVTIGFVGLVTPITPEISHPDCLTIDFADPVKCYARAAEQLKGRVDWIVPLTHLGVEMDKALARARPELEVIVGGHSHTTLKEGVREGSTLIVQTGSKASALGRVDVWLDKSTKKVVETRASLIELLDEPPAEFADQPVAIIAKNLVQRTEQRMKEPVGEMTATAERTKDPVASSAMGNLMTDALRAYTRAEVGLMNRGGIRADLQKGTITRRDVFEVMPFDNSVVVLKLTGAELFEFVRRAVEGTAHSGIEASGITIEVTQAAGGKRTLTGLRVGADALDQARVYRVAMNSFMADGGDAYIDKVPPGEKRTDDVLLLRDMLEQMFVNKKQVTAATDNRYKVTKS